MIIKKPTFHLHRRGRPGGSFGLRIYIFQVCLFSPGLPRAPTVAVLGESLSKSIMLGAFLLLRNRFFWNWHEGKRNSHHSAPAEEDFLQSACFPPRKSLDVSSGTLFIWIIFKKLMRQIGRLLCQPSNTAHLKICVGKLGKPCDRCTVEKLPKLSPADEFFFGRQIFSSPGDKFNFPLQTRSYFLGRQILFSWFCCPPVESSEDWIDGVCELKSFAIPHLHKLRLIKAVRE